MSSGFHSATFSLGQLLSSPFAFTVPDYQRPYSWTLEEAEQLLDDLNLAVDEAPEPHTAPKIGPDANTDTAEADAGYFFGAVLLMAHALPPPGQVAAQAPRLYDIVDGQQRLVTLTMLLAVLRDLVAELGGSLEAIVQPLLWNGIGPDATPRLSLRGRENTFLRAFVQDAGASAIMPSDEDLTPGESRLLAVREFLAAELLGLNRADLERFSAYLIGSCHFAVITTTTVDRAHRIFSVLNERGRPLARNDILKAQILGAIAPARRAHYTEAWDRMERDLGGDFESVFSHIRNIEDRGRSKIIGGIADLMAGRGGAVPFFNEVLQPYAAIFAALKTPGITTGAQPAGAQKSSAPQASAQLSNDQSTIARALTYLGWLGSADWMPAAMLFWRTCEGDASRLASFLVRLDRLAYGLRLLGVGVDKRRARLQALVNVIRQGANLDAPDSPLEFARDELRNINYNLRNLHARSPLTCKLVLLRLNDEIAGHARDLDPSRLTVEHVLPQKPARTGQWREWFPDADEREACTHSLGNLVLIKKDENERARNLELARKQGHYFARGRDEALPITRDIFGIETWRPDDIKAREEKLLARLVELWRLEPGNGRSADREAKPEPRPPSRRKRRTNDRD